MSEDSARWEEVDGYIGGQLVAQDEALTSALTASAAAGLPAINVAPNQGKLLHLLVRAVRARRILEVGTLGGYSAIWLARALPADGRLVTVEASPVHAEVAQKNLERAGVSDRVEIRIGAGMEVLPALADEHPEPFDLVFVDADKVNNAGYVTWGLQMSHPGTLIVVDNVVRRGAVADAGSDDPDVQGSRALYELLASEPRLDATAVQTVGVKGYDGFALALVTR